MAVKTTNMKLRAEPVADCTVVGAGVVGLMTALALSKRGYSVTLLDRQASGQAASWAGGGILSALQPWQLSSNLQQLLLDSIARYPAIVDELRDETGIDPEYWRSGGLWLQLPSASQYKIECFLKQSDWPYEWQQEDNNRHNKQDRYRLWVPGLASVRNPRLLKALIQSVRQASNIKLLEHAECVQIESQGPKVMGIQTETAYVPVARLIVCAGAWTGKLLAPLGQRIDVSPVKGQMLLFSPPRVRLDRISLGKGFYLIPRRDGQVLAGSTVEDVGFDTQPTVEAYQHLHQQAVAHWPSLLDAPVRAQWSGLRPGSKGGEPYIGLHPDYDNLYINAGHFRNGLCLAPGSAHRLVENLK